MLFDIVGLLRRAARSDPLGGVIVRILVFDPVWRSQAVIDGENNVTSRIQIARGIQQLLWAVVIAAAILAGVNEDHSGPGRSAVARDKLNPA
jgi:hypothetical protein